MERLQVAIEKARAQRQGKTDDAPAKAQTQQPVTQPAETTDIDSASALWEALPKYKLDRRKLHRGRVNTLETGPDSAPYDLLRTRMLQQARHNGWSRIALVSPHSGCGKSTTTANLAFSLGRQREMRSIVLDMDLRRSGLSRMLTQYSGPGLAEVLEGTAPFAQEAQRHGANVAFGFNTGTKSKTSSEILQSRGTTQILDEITETYQPNVMLFDMPALFSSDDNFGFLQNVDAALILAAAEKTPMSQIDQAERQIAELTSVMGIVLNKCRYTSGAYGHEYDDY